MGIDRTRVVKMLQENKIEFEIRMSKELNGYVKSIRIPGSQPKVEGGNWVSFDFGPDGSLTRISTIEYWAGLEDD